MEFHFILSKSHIEDAMEKWGMDRAELLGQLVDHLSDLSSEMSIYKENEHVVVRSEGVNVFALLDFKPR